MTDYIYTLKLEAGKDGVPDLNVLFPNGADKIYFYAAVNTTVPKEKTLAEVRALPITTAFTDPFVMTGEKELSLSSTGISGNIDLKRLAAKMIFTVKVNNRVVVKNKSKDEYDEVWTPLLTGTNARVYLSNAVFNTNLGAVKGNTNAAYAYPTTLDQDDYAPENIKLPDGTVLPETGQSTLVSQADYYTYPLRWNGGDDTEPFVKVIIPWRVVRTQTVGEGDDAVDMVTYEGEPELYYKVLLPDLQIKANCLYHFTIDISVIGTEGEPQVELVAKAIVLDWQGIDDAIDTDIADVKYLTLEKEHVDFYTNSTNVYFAHSEPVTPTVVRIVHKDLYTGEETVIANNGYVTISEDGDHVVVNHALNNDLTSEDFDVSPYYFYVTLHLENDTGNRYDKQVTFVQYPSLYIQDVESNGKVFVNGQGYMENILYQYYNGGRLQTYYYTPVYNNNTSDGFPHYAVSGRYYVTPDRWEDPTRINKQVGNIGSVADPSSITGELTGNMNKNQYIIKVSVLPEGSSNYIGDPRQGSTTAVGNLGYQTFSWGNRSYSNYYEWYYYTPTTSTNSNVSSQYKPGADDSQHIVAPRFMIASSYGKTTSMNYEKAKERCAAYQENGYPAGRWRLPTVAEIDFLIRMNEKNKIPSLFGPGWDGTGENLHYVGYWAAGEYAFCGKDSPVTGVYALDFSSTGSKTGTTDDGVSRSYDVKIRPSGTDRQYQASYNGTATNYHVYTRCVYDIWYWGDAPMKGDGSYVKKNADGEFNTNADGTIIGAAETWLGYKLQ